MPTINTDVAVTDTQSAALTEDGAAAAFLSKWSEDGESLSEDREETAEAEEEDNPSEEPQEEPETPEEPSEESQDHPDEEPEDQDEDEEQEEAEEEPEEAKTLADDALVKVKVDGKDVDVSVRELKRLYGQEKALTRKSQEVANQRKESDANAARLQAAYQKLYDKALERFKPYSEIDMLVASKQLDTEQFAALRKEAQAAYEDFQFVSQEADAFVKAQQAEAQKNLQAQAREAVKVLKAEIPDWSDKLYSDIREFAIGKGIDAAVVNNIVDPVTIKILHQARLYEKSKEIATVKKKALAPKKVLKSTTNTSVKELKSDSVFKARKQFSSSGTTDDATNLFLAKWASDE